MDAECERMLLSEKNIQRTKPHIGRRRPKHFRQNQKTCQATRRDIIIFSIGYARSAYDKVVAQFGSLSMEGGENP